jgi:hypothetical protein
LKPRHQHQRGKDRDRADQALQRIGPGVLRLADAGVVDRQQRRAEQPGRPAPPAGIEEHAPTIGDDEDGREAEGDGEAAEAELGIAEGIRVQSLRIE